MSGELDKTIGEFITGQRARIYKDTYVTLVGHFVGDREEGYIEEVPPKGFTTQHAFKGRVLDSERISNMIEGQIPVGLKVDTNTNVYCVDPSTEVGTL